MASTIFTNGVTLTDAAWFQDVNDLTYNCLGPSKLTNTLAADVDLSNTGNYFTGPTNAQGTTGTWVAIGQVVALDTAGAASFDAKLWDGTTVIASARFTSTGANVEAIFALSGVITSPAGNIRISVRDETSTSGKIKFNQSGNSKDASLTVFRIA